MVLGRALSRFTAGILLTQHLLFVLLVVPPANVHSFLGNRQAHKPATQQCLQDVNPLKVRIRWTQESDLHDISHMLSTAVVDPLDKKCWNNWRANIDRLWAKADIESLLRCRLQAIEQGRKIHYNLQSIEDLGAQDKLKLMWANDALRNRIEKASRETGEPNLWKQHNFALPPQDPDWLNHLQMTAENVYTGEVIGFCEVAMLHNPVLEEREECVLSYSPAITNLATAPEYRRQGIAKRLLKTAERFVELQWQAESLGLYVEQTNKAALSLYERMGYKAETACDGGDQLGDMWYMGRGLTGRQSANLVVHRDAVLMEA